MPTKKTKTKPETTSPRAPDQDAAMTDYQVKFDPAALQDLEGVSDQATVEVILRRASELRQEPMKQGKPLKGVLKNYRSVRAAGQRYRLVYQVAVEAGQVVIVVIGIRKEGDRKDAYVIAEKRLQK